MLWNLPEAGSACTYHKLVEVFERLQAVNVAGAAAVS